jgi:hypothetical protein
VQQVEVQPHQDRRRNRCPDQDGRYERINNHLGVQERNENYRPVDKDVIAQADEEVGSIDKARRALEMNVLWTANDQPPVTAPPVK